MEVSRSRAGVVVVAVDMEGSVEVRLVCPEAVSSLEGNLVTIIESLSTETVGL